MSCDKRSLTYFCGFAQFGFDYRVSRNTNDLPPQPSDSLVIGHQQPRICDGDHEVYRDNEVLITRM